jgi:hypothetical protein
MVASPVVPLAPLVVLDEHQQAVGLALGEMPRAGRSYNERSMSVDSIRVVRSELESAGADWTPVVYLADQNHPRDS